MAGADWDDAGDSPPPARRGRSHKASRREAQKLIDQLDWCEWPIVYWAGPSAGFLPAGSETDAEGVFDALHVVGKRLSRRAAGAYAVQLIPPTLGAALPETKLPQLLSATCPVIGRLEPIDDALIADAWGRILKARRFPAAISQLADDAAAWEAVKETQIQRARLVLDAVQASARARTGGAQLSEALALESLCIWVGAHESRPSARLGARVPFDAGATQAVREVLSMRLGQAHAQRLPPREMIGWYRCGRALSAWPPDVVMQAARAMGDPHRLADRVDTLPELADALVGSLVRETLLMGHSGGQGDGHVGQELQQRLSDIPSILGAWKCLHSGPALDGAWKRHFLMVALRCIPSGSGVEGLISWATACRKAFAAGDDSNNAIPAALLAPPGLVALTAPAPAARPAIWKMLVDTAPALLANVRRNEKLSKEAPLEWASLRPSFEFACTATAAGADTPGVALIFRHNLIADAQWVLLSPRGGATALAAMVRWAQSLEATGDGAIFERWGLAPNIRQTWVRVFGLLEEKPLLRFINAAAERLPEQGQQNGQLYWLFNFLGGSDGSDVPSDRTAAFLHRHADLLLATSAHACRHAASNQLLWARLRDWRQCVATARVWDLAGFDDGDRLLRRLIAEQSRQPATLPFSYFEGDLLRTLLRLSNGHVDRAVALAFTKLDLGDHDLAQIEAAWELLEPLPEVAEFFSRLTGNERSAGRALRWLARLGFCLRLQRPARLRGKLEALNLFPAPLAPREPSGSAAGRPDADTPQAGGRARESPDDLKLLNARSDPSPQPSPLSTGATGPDALPPEFAGDLALLLRLLPDHQCPHRVAEILERPEKLARERATLEARADVLSPNVARRLRNLRTYLDDPGEMQRWIARDLKSTLRDFLDEARLATLERLTREITDAHVRKLIGAPQPPGADGRDWDNAVRLYFSVKKNRKLLKRLLRHEARGDRTWIRAHPSNRAFLDQMTAGGVDIDVWLGDFDRVVETPGGTWVLSLETLPLRVLQMGNYFDTCLSVDGANAFSTIANACESNKRVVYVRDERGVVIGRKLLALTDDQFIAGFHSYGVGPLDMYSEGAWSPWMKIHLDIFCRQLADRCYAKLLPTPGTREWASVNIKGLFARWYDDGVEPFDKVWVRHDAEGLRQAFQENKCPPELLADLQDAAEYNRQGAARALVWLGDAAVELLNAFLVVDDQKPKPGDDTFLKFLLRLLARHAAGTELRKIAQEQLDNRFGQVD